MTKQGKHIPTEFKQEAANLALDQGDSIKEACQSMGVCESAMRRWVGQLNAERAGTTPTESKTLTVEQQRIQERQVQNQRLEREQATLYLDGSVLLVSGGGAGFIETACSGLDVFKTPRSDFGIQALRIAYESRGCPEPVLFHSDQGCHYTSRAFRQQPCHYQLGKSMSRRGHCWDHVPMERFFRRYKTEGIPTNGYNSFAEAEQDIALYMKHDNYERGHSVNDSLSPAMALAA